MGSRKSSIKFELRGPVGRVFDTKLYDLGIRLKQKVLEASDMSCLDLYHGKLPKSS
jgi:hypothetical protein